MALIGKRRTRHPESANGPLPENAARAIRWPLRLTWAGLWAERLARAFWPLWTVALLAFATIASGLHEIGPILWVRLVAAVVLAAALAALIAGLFRFRRPTRVEAMQRLDHSLPGRPIMALKDRQAIGAADPDSASVWQAHLSRMEAWLHDARPVAPNLRLASRDPYGLRYIALTLAVMAAIFGNLWRLPEIVGLVPATAEAKAAGTIWEGWARPPAYTAKPVIYLNDVAGDQIRLPVGTRLQIRLYGNGGAGIEQNIDPEMAAGAHEDVAEMTVARSGQLAIGGRGGREWEITSIPDKTPVIKVSGDMEREADGRFRQGFEATDDYGVTAGSVTISLDLDRVERRYGLGIDPDPVAPVTLDLPMPIRGSRTEMAGILVDDLSQSILANLPVRMVFSARDAAGQQGESGQYRTILPGRRFFDPMARAVIEMRRDLMWSNRNRLRVTELLKAMTHRSDEITRSLQAVARLRGMIRRLDGANDALAPDVLNELAEEMWQIALMFEEGDLISARDRLQRAQDRLEEAIRNGASPKEIDQLMKELQQAMRDYTRELARQNENRGETSSGQGQEVTADQIQQMMDEIERLMNEGKTAEAMDLMRQLRELMDRLEVRPGQGGSGDQAMEDLGNTLKDQRDLSDDAYRGLQENLRGEGNKGREQGNADALADRQRDLRDRLDGMQQGALPGDGTEKGEAGRESLNRAEEAMRRAEQALKDGDLSGAMDEQAEAMEAMREGQRNFAGALADKAGDEDRRDQRQAERSEQDGAGQVDPLGRQTQNGARIGSDHNLMPDTPDHRAQELLEELRRRSGEAERPRAELDYLRRLLDQF